MIYILLFIIVIGLAAMPQLSVAASARGQFSRPYSSIQQFDAAGFFARVLLPAAVIGAIIGLRESVGTDFDNYVDQFYAIADHYHVLYREPLYTASAKVVALVGVQHHGWLFMCALATNLLFLHGVWRSKSEHPTLVIVGLFGLGFIMLQANQVAQSLAVALGFFATPYIWKNSFWKHTSVFLVAAGFHYSAIFVYPLCWLARFRWPMWALATVACTGLLLFLFPDVMRTILLNSAPAFPDQYSDLIVRSVRADSQTDTGFGVLALWLSVVACTGLLGFQMGELDRRSRVIVNLAVLAVSINAALANLWAVNRVATYLVVYLAPFASVIVSRTGHKVDKYVVYVGWMVLFVTSFCWSLYTNAHDALPYHFVLSAT